MKKNRSKVSGTSSRSAKRDLNNGKAGEGFVLLLGEDKLDGIAKSFCVDIVNQLQEKYGVNAGEIAICSDSPSVAKGSDVEKRGNFLRSPDMLDLKLEMLRKGNRPLTPRVYPLLSPYNTNYYSTTDNYNAKLLNSQVNGVEIFHVGCVGEVSAELEAKTIAYHIQCIKEIAGKKYIVCVLRAEHLYDTGGQEEAGQTAGAWSSIGAGMNKNDDETLPMDLKRNGIDAHWYIPVRFRSSKQEEAINDYLRGNLYHRRMVSDQTYIRYHTKTPGDKTEENILKKKLNGKFVYLGDGESYNKNKVAICGALIATISDLRLPEAGEKLVASYGEEGSSAGSCVPHKKSRTTPEMPNLTAQDSPSFRGGITAKRKKELKSNQFSRRY